MNMKSHALIQYSLERDSLSVAEINSILDRGVQLASRTDLAVCLSQEGSAVFPHTYITKCGDQIAAVAEACLQACLRTGKSQILAIGVLHPLIPALIESRKKEMDGLPIFDDPCRGIFGPGLSQEELTQKEFSLDHFVFLLEHAAKRKRMPVPQLLIRYPNLIYGEPESMKGIEDLKQLARESIVVATSDLCHHGTAYGLSREKALPMSKEGIAFARQAIEKNLHLLSNNDLLAYRQYSLDSLSDSVEVGQLLRFLLGPLEGSIRDLRLVDVSDLFERNPEPSWVAAALVELKKLKL